jgi:hypothetical protein
MSEAKLQEFEIPVVLCLSSEDAEIAIERLSPIKTRAYKPATDGSRMIVAIVKAPHLGQARGQLIIDLASRIVGAKER